MPLTNSFITDHSARHKDNKPNLGEFLPLLSVSYYTWDDVKKCVVQETLDRNSLWLMLADRSLKYVKTYRNDSTSVSKRVAFAFDTVR